MDTWSVVIFFIHMGLCIGSRLSVWDGIRIRGTDTKGRIEVKVKGKWGLICDHDWTIEDANVACRQLQFDGALRAFKFNARGTNRTIITLYRNITCEGFENALEDCQGVFGTIKKCWIGDVVQVECIPPMPGNTSVSCSNRQLLCKQKNMCIPQRWKCDNVDDCGNLSDEMNCSVKINLPLPSHPFRLVGGPGPYAGRLEVQYAGLWGTVCDDGFTKSSAKVLCRQLGYPDVSRLKRFKRVNEQQIWLDEVHCQGNETSLTECLKKPFGVHDCDHREDVGVICKHNKTRLTTSPSHTTTTTTLFTERSQVCGIQQFPVRDLRIVGGQVANNGSWPWQATINVFLPLGRSEHICGGTLIYKQWVLTSAHCFDKTRDTTKYEVILGDYNLDVAEKSEQKFNVEKIIVHSQYISGYHPNDIALVKLSRPANLTSKYVNTACVPSPGADTESGYCYATGWGDTKATGNERILNQVRLPIYPLTECTQRYGSKVTNDMICAGYEFGGRDACKGDSGGPFVCKQDSRWYVLGITTWGQGCAEPHHPGVYINVQHYLFWIKQSVALADNSNLPMNPFSNLVG